MVAWSEYRRLRVTHNYSHNKILKGPTQTTTCHLYMHVHEGTNYWGLIWVYMQAFDSLRYLKKLYYRIAGNFRGVKISFTLNAEIFVSKRFVFCAHDNYILSAQQTKLLLTNISAFNVNEIFIPRKLRAIRYYKFFKYLRL